jgi:hypothetical protein
MENPVANPITGYMMDKHCNRCGDPVAVRYIYLPFEKRYVGLCYVCCKGLQDYFIHDIPMASTLKDYKEWIVGKDNVKNLEESEF